MLLARRASRPFANLFATAALALCALSACRETPQPAHTPARVQASEPEVVLAPEGAEPVHVKVELARTPDELQRGLMFRDKLEAGRGMLFLFPTQRHLAFWMKNTYIPLDMIFLGADHRVVGVVRSAAPLTEDERSVEGDSQFVLEVPGGYATAHRIGPGTPATFLGTE